MRVAVVIPCFNDGEFLGDAIASLEEQEPHELVVVDDGSTDPATLELLESLQASGTNVVSQANAGLGPARMAGLAATTAPYVHPLDADDCFPPGTLTLLADALDADPAAGAAWGSYRTFGSMDCHFPTAPRLDPWRIAYIDEIPATVMFRREIFETHGGWEHVGYEDWDYWMKLAENEVSGIGVDEVTLLRREHASPRLLAETMLDFDRHYRILRERHPALFAARRANRRRSHSPRMLKLLLPLIEAVPGVSDLRKWQGWMAARYVFEREMASDCYRGPVERLRDRLYHRSA